MSLALYIARKIYNDKGDKRQVSRPAIRIATIGVAIGLAVMIVSVSVVLGFKHTIRDKAIGFGSHIVVTDFLAMQDDRPYPIVMDSSMMNRLKGINGVKHVQRYAMKQGILKTDNDFMGVMFKGVAEEFDTTFISENMLEGEIPKFSSETGSNKILISKMNADKLGLKLGDKVFAYFINNNDVRARRFSIVGIYQTNLTKFDKTICFCDLYTSVKLNGWESDQASGAELTVNDYSRLAEVEDNVVRKINRTTDKYGQTYSSATIEQVNPQIFTWLDLLDLNVWIILALMVCVAGITMISGLLIIILERTNMIGLMKALGARNKTIRHTFLWFSVFIIGRGMLWGNIVGIGLLMLQHFTGMVSLDPTTYYVSTVPVELDFYIIAAINAATLIVCVLSLIAPSYLVSFIHPAKSMRYE
ncbi:MAG: FtsX-like permease family protein [Prevotella sp.]|uniref:ABC transporter permease n=1 Tax=Prevotella sp. TaxID=59823 RepID=UPI002A2D3A12|nr:FtsX-like permease family protein [Prevotella sp.]MDD7318638.1 ABC transporter permease [Prevotellaceae bacterium]MDY4019406.1 FtsX-like permease family protein [Prevotella sp.]